MRTIIASDLCSLYNGTMYYNELGYGDFDDYLVGPEGKTIKQFYYEHCKKYECDICGTRERILLHKRSYKFLSLPELKKRYKGDATKILRYLHTYMVYLCQGCNRRVHLYADGTRVPLEYRKLKDREQQVRRVVRKVPQGRSQPARKMSFLGTYFQQFIKK
jgi:hypothetical protein